MTIDAMIRAIVRDEMDLRFPPPVFEEANPAGKVEHLRGEKLPQRQVGKAPELAQGYGAPNGTELGSLPPTFDQVKAAFIAMMKRDAALGQPLLDKFGIARLSEAKPEQYADIIKACG